MNKIPDQLIQALLFNTSPEYIDDLYTKFKKDPLSVQEDWRSFFLGIHFSQDTNSALIKKELEIKQLIDDVRTHGHRYAHANILEEVSKDNELQKRLDQITGNQHFMATQFAGFENITTNQLKVHLEKVFVGTMGIEFGHVNDLQVHTWIESKLNPKNIKPIGNDKKVEILKQLFAATLLEEFLQNNYQGKKRFSLEGCESLLCALHTLAQEATDNETKEISLAMAHRGRLNVLANFLEWPLNKIFSEFEELVAANELDIMGDVKYHLGHSNDILINNKKLHISLAFNPSHLEFIYPVVLGKTKAKEKNRYHGDNRAILPVVIHGDAAVIGQGIVAETLNLSELDAYTLGGTIHFIINNQIGFTAQSNETRSTHYCTDFAKAIEAPIFHINGNDVESIVNVTRLAFEFRHKFSRDIFIDINCFRKHGHNETDEPRYSNPLLYTKVKKQDSVAQKYKEHLLKKEIITSEFVNSYIKSYSQKLSDCLKSIKEENIIPVRNEVSGEWEELKPPPYQELIKKFESPIKKDVFSLIVQQIHLIPKDLNVLPKLKRSLDKRLSKVEKTGKINWALAELISFGSLLKEGVSVRLVGQDSVRGTFSQRHASYVDQKSGENYIPLKALENNSTFEVYNSPLCESAAMGFEYGYSLSAPHTLNLWEAQFGDFCNVAQVIIDQFIVASEAKWGMFNGLVLLLPHGHEGQGPDHSSARVERFLQLAAQGNIQISNPSTAAQYFHLLRRQVLRNFRKPLIIFTPKAYLRSDLISSPQEQFLEGGFSPVLSSPITQKEKKGLVCTGKIYWELYEEAKKRNILDQILFVRLEQLYPLDIKELKKLVDKNQHIQNWYWVQEEPQNCGAWSFIKLNTLSLNWNLKYIGRPIKASTAEGNASLHKKNQEYIINQSLRGLA